jgi:hypothetical protein
MAQAGMQPILKVAVLNQLPQNKRLRPRLPHVQQAALVIKKLN